MVLFLLLICHFTKETTTLHVSCDDSIFAYAYQFAEDSQFVDSFYEYFLHNITFMYNGTFGEIQFDPCNSATTLSEFDMKIYDQNLNQIAVRRDCDLVSCCSTKTSKLLENKVYHIVIESMKNDPNKTLKIDVKCSCDYKCTSPITCGDSVEYYVYEFNYATVNEKLDVLSTQYYISNLTFLYDQTFDNIIFDTCNNETTLNNVALSIFDSNANKIAGTIYSVCAKLNVTSLVQNELYRIIIHSEVYRPDKVVKLDISCQCDCNYFIAKNNLANKHINIYDIIDIQFNIKIFSGCQSQICNIFHICSSTKNSLPKLSIDASNHFIIQFSTNNEHDNIFYINDSIQLDDQYHTISIFITNHGLLFMYDNITYLNIESPNFFYHTKYQLNSNSLYISSPWDDSINGTIDRIYVNSKISNDYIVQYSTNFILVTKWLNWINALLFCQNNFNSTLAVIQTDAEFEEIVYLRNNISESIQYSDLWVGMTYDENQGTVWFGCEETSNTCNANAYLDYRAVSSYSSCGYMSGGNDDPVFGISNANCYISNHFLCDRRISGKLQLAEFITNRSDLTCNYYHSDVITGDVPVFENVWIGTEIKISLDIKLNDSCTSDNCNIFYLKNDNNYFASLHINHQNYLQLGILDGDTMEYIDTQLDINMMFHKNNTRIDLLISETKQLLNLNGKTYFINYKEYLFDIDNLKTNKYQFWVSGFNTSVSHICINSNMIRSNDIWYKLGDIEDHNDPWLTSIFSYNNDYSQPIFYYQNFTIIVFDEFVWLKYIENDTYYHVLRQEQSYPYATSGDVYEPIIATCEWLGDSLCGAGSLQMQSQQFGQNSLNKVLITEYYKDEFDWKDEDNDEIEVGYIISNDHDGISYLSFFKLSSFSKLALDNKNVIATTMDSVKMPEFLIQNGYAVNTCITSNQTHIFLINQGIIIVNIADYIEQIVCGDCESKNATGYYEDSNGNIIDTRSQWIIYNDTIESRKINLIFNVSNIDLDVFNISNVGCSITDTFEDIYIFGGLINSTIPSDKVYKYNILNDNIMLIEDIKLNSKSYNLRAIQAHNNKIYLFGGVNIDKNNKRQIFNIKNESFETTLIEDGDNHYAASTFNNDHKVIIRYNAKHRTIEYFIPELITIDFTPMVTNKWRYDDINVEYIFLDYNYYIDQYSVLWELGEINMTGHNSFLTYRDWSSTNVHQMLVSVSACEWCHGYNAHGTANCEKCNSVDSYYWGTSTHLDTFCMKSSDVSIIPYSSCLEVNYLECYIHLGLSSKITITSTHIEPISITTEPSSHCPQNPITYEKTGTASESRTYPYSVFINSSVGDISHFILVDVEPTLSDGVVNCTVCDKYHNCSDCDDGIIPNCTLESCDVDIIEINLFAPPLYPRWSHNAIQYLATEVIQDLVISPQSHNVSIISFQPPDAKISTHWVNKYKYYMISISVLLFIGISSILYYFHWRNKRLKKEVEIQRQYTQIIRNPLVISIGIASYNDDAQNPDIDNIYLNDLDGVDVDIRNIEKMCKQYNYDLYPKQFKEEWTQDEVLEILRQCATKAATGNYDSILFISSSHGIDHSIITSDYRSINKDAIHRVFSVNFPALRELPRIFIYDCCSGANERTNESFLDTENVNEGGKNITVAIGDVGKNVQPDDIGFHPSFRGDTWRSNERNPDFKISTIHAANLGFQSKLNSINGSYLIHEWVLAMMRNAEKTKDEDREFFGDMMDSIQEILHSKGKQQTVNTYNNHTRYLKFSVNVCDRDDLDNSEEEMENNDLNEMLIGTNQLDKSELIMVKSTSVNNDASVRKMETKSIQINKQHTNEYQNENKASLELTDENCVNFDIVELEKICAEINVEHISTSTENSIQL